MPGSLCKEWSACDVSGHSHPQVSAQSSIHLNQHTAIFHSLVELRDVVCGQDENSTSCIHRRLETLLCKLREVIHFIEDVCHEIGVIALQALQRTIRPACTQGQRCEGKMRCWADLRCESCVSFKTTAVRLSAVTCEWPVTGCQNWRRSPVAASLTKRLLSFPLPLCTCCIGVCEFDTPCLTPQPLHNQREKIAPFLYCHYRSLWPWAMCP